MDEKVKEIKSFLLDYEAEYSHGGEPLIAQKIYIDHVSTLLSLLSEKEKKIEELENRILRMIRGEFKQICSHCGYETEKGEWEELQKHLKECPKHPLRQAEARIKSLEEGIEKHKEKNITMRKKFTFVDGKQWPMTDFDKELYKLI
jgi:hypothetical protein